LYLQEQIKSIIIRVNKEYWGRYLLLHSTGKIVISVVNFDVGFLFSSTSFSHQQTPTSRPRWWYFRQPHSTISKRPRHDLDGGSDVSMRGKNGARASCVGPRDCF
jgi:hypothetical protein